MNPKFYIAIGLISIWRNLYLVYGFAILSPFLLAVQNVGGVILLYDFQIKWHPASQKNAIYLFDDIECFV